MATMTIYRGFPASGKTTAARKAVAKSPHDTVEINRDNTRELIGVVGKFGNTHQENLVTEINSAILSDCLKEGKNIIVSDTNLRVRYVKNYVRQALIHNYIIDIVDFNDVPLEELVARDNGRKDSVGEEVIRDMWRKFPYSRWKSADSIISEVKNTLDNDHAPVENYRNDPELPPAIIVDIDGTIANHHGIRDVFDYTQVINDTPHEDIIDIVRLEKNAGTTILVVSGREDSCKKDTLAWLDKHNVPHDQLWMRATGDRRKDSVIKEEIIRGNIENNYYVKYCLDDRNSVVEANRQRGYRVLQVAPGDF